MLTQSDTYVIIYYKEAFELVYSTFTDREKCLLWLANYQLENQEEHDVRIISVIKGQAMVLKMPEEIPHEY